MKKIKATQKQFANMKKLKAAKKELDLELMHRDRAANLLEEVGLVLQARILDGDGTAEDIENLRDTLDEL
jgi:hypothetical protein